MISTVPYRTVTVLLLDSIDQECLKTIGIEDCFGSTGLVVKLCIIPYCSEQKYIFSYGEHPHDAVEEWAALTEPKLNIEGNKILAPLSLDAFLFGIKSFILIPND
jgi:hypothetical protein